MTATPRTTTGELGTRRCLPLFARAGACSPLTSGYAILTVHVSQGVRDVLQDHGRGPARPVPLVHPEPGEPFMCVPPHSFRDLAATAAPLTLTFSPFLPLYSPEPGPATQTLSPSQIFASALT
jgi:hypothetical protein